MTETKQKPVLPIWITVIDLILIVAAFILSLLALAGKGLDIYMILSILSSILVVLSGAYYCFSGYKKDGSIYFKLFVYLFALNHLFILISLSQTGVPAINIALYAIPYGLLNILAAAQDLGKKRSYILACAILALRLAGLFSFLTSPKAGAGSTLYAILSGLILSVLLFIAVIGKYSDKENRNRPV